MSTEHRRLAHALLLSLVIHALLLSLTFGGQGLWLPGFGFPWQDRRIEAPDLRVVVVPAQVTPRSRRSRRSRSRAAGMGRQPVAVGRRRRHPCPVRRPRDGCSSDQCREASPRPDAATGAAPRKMPLRADRPVTRHPRRSRAGRDRLGADRRGHVGRARRSSDANARHCGSAKRREPGDRDAVASRCWRCSAGANRPGARRSQPSNGPGSSRPGRRGNDRQRQRGGGAGRGRSRRPNARRPHGGRSRSGRGRRVEAAQVEAAQVEAARVEAARSRRHGSRLQGRGRTGRGGRSRPHGSRPHRSRPQVEAARSRPHGSRPHGSRPHGSRLHGPRPPGRGRPGRSRTGRCCARGGRKKGSDASGDRTTAGRGGRPA